jgi:hypothetical protein
MRPDLNCSHFHGKTTGDKPQGQQNLIQMSPLEQQYSTILQAMLFFRPGPAPAPALRKTKLAQNIF